MADPFRKAIFSARGDGLYLTVKDDGRGERTRLIAFPKDAKSARVAAGAALMLAGYSVAG